MMLDLNAAARAWGGYTGGQVIKHGAESGNIQFPQEISDGIVTVGPGHMNFDPDTKDEAKGQNYTLVLAKLAMFKRGIEFPINPKLDLLYSRIKFKREWIEAACDEALFVAGTINLQKVREKIQSIK
jgi:hypothetical protein